jgi:hypothetical protein
MQETPILFLQAVLISISTQVAYREQYEVPYGEHPAHDGITMCSR